MASRREMIMSHGVPDEGPVTPQDPPPSERRYFRNKRTGDRAYLVERDGKTYMRLDRSLEEILKPYNGSTQSMWEADGEWRPLNRVAIAQICFEADKVLIRALGDFEHSKKEWLSLRPHQRQIWMDGGLRNPARRALWEAIQAAMEPLAR